MAAAAADLWHDCCSMRTRPRPAARCWNRPRPRHLMIPQRPSDFRRNRTGRGKIQRRPSQSRSRTVHHQLRTSECGEGQNGSSGGACGPGLGGRSPRRLEGNSGAVKRLARGSSPGTAASSSTRLGCALFQLGRTDDAFAALTQAVKDEPALEPAAVSMALLSKPEGRSEEGRGMV